MDNIKKFAEIIKVVDCGHSLEKVRVGNQCDGGYVLLDEINRRHTDFCYSFGVGDDVGFELDFANKYPGTRFRMFDPTIDRLPEEHKDFVFDKTALGENNLIFIHGKTLLKIDVEWAEWDVLSKVPMSYLLNCSQILIEFHLVHAEQQPGLSPYFNSFYKQCFDRINNKLFFSYIRVINKLCEFFHIFHIHANNSLPKKRMGDCWMPPLLELSFVRKDLIESTRMTESNFPVPGLDFANKTDRDDITNVYPLGNK